MSEYINAHQMRHTPERNIVLQGIVNIGNPFSVNELIENLKSAYISEATVYNTLKLLIAANIVRALPKQFCSRTTTYELLSGNNTYMSFVCKRCGRVVEFRDKALEERIGAHKYSNFNFQHYSLYVYGMCKVCRRLKQI